MATTIEQGECAYCGATDVEDADPRTLDAAAAAAARTLARGRDRHRADRDGDRQATRGVGGGVVIALFGWIYTSPIKTDR